MELSSQTAGLIAAGAGAVALVALALAVALAVRLRRLRADQAVLLADGSSGDLVSQVAGLRRDVEGFDLYLGDVAAKLLDRFELVERRLDGTLAHRGVVRYDAYGEMSGRQSMSMALLDAHGSGVVLSSIHHRDHARLYAKQVHEGRAELELLPEELEAMQLATAPQPAPEPSA